MRPILLLACLILISSLSSSHSHAQPYSSAWFVGMGGGLAAHDNGAFSRRLKSYTPLRDNGEDYLYQTGDFATAGTTLNMGAGFLFSESYLVGVSAENVSYPVVHSINAPGNARDDYKLGGQGVGLDLGVAAVNDAGMFVFPYLHLGYYDYELGYTNNQGDSIPFFEGKPVPPGTTATYTGAAPRVAVGIGMVKLIDGAGSFNGVLIARLTWGVMPSRPEWLEPDGTVVNNGGLTPAYNGVALSISFGAGGVW